jgi:tripartite-type tricarboxylate transporter receptor subunit TctC
MFRYLLALCAVVAMTAAGAQDFPTKPVKIVVPFAPGAGNDTLGRLTAEYLTPRLGQAVVVENKAGAGSQIGIDFVAKSPPDGYTLVWAASDGITILPAVKPNMPYKVPDDFAFIARIVQIPFVIAVNPDLPIKNVADLVAYAKANPGKVTYASQGNGSTSHLTGQMFATMTGVEMVHVPFKGEGPALTELIGGRVDLFLGNVSAVLKFREGKQVKLLGLAGTKRGFMAPEVPSAPEIGLPEFISSAWFAVAAPPGTPPAIALKLNAAIADIMKLPDVQQKIAAQGAEVVGGSPAEMVTFLNAERARWKKVIETANVKLD